MKTITEAILNRKIITEFTQEELIEFAYGAFIMNILILPCYGGV